MALLIAFFQKLMGSIAVLVLLFFFVIGCRRQPPPPPLLSEKKIEPAVEVPHIEIIGSSRLLLFCSGGRVEKQFPSVRFGWSGVGIKSKRGDGKTPVGNFKVTRITNNSKFRTFIAINYPTLDYAKAALSNGLVHNNQYHQIINAIQADQIPPQDTPIGGMLGIHGLGTSNPSIHKIANWTDGCVALTNDQIEELAKFVKIGMPVIIREMGEDRCLKLEP